jgi:2-polyprenyl-3-methyl-5-hydroxy-6-metoxy-1,4-benzoquinol methylase
MNNHYSSCPLCTTVARFCFNKYERDFYTCASCGLEFIHPQPTPEEISALYDQSYYDSWGLDGCDDATERMKHSTFHDKLDIVEGFMPGKGDILDIGCATGFFLDAARQRGWNPYGVELSDYSSDIARKKIGTDRIITGRVEDAAFKDATFDAIVMTDVIEHVCDVHSFLGEVSRILKPGGIISITTPNPASLSCQLLGKNWPHYKLEHLMYYTPKALELLLEPLGYRRLYLSAATKTLTLAYLELQMRTYPVSFVTPLITALSRLVPTATTHSRFRLYSGELFLISRLGTESCL